MSLFRSLPPPAHRFFPILFYTISVKITTSQIALRTGISLFRSFAVPTHRFRTVMLHAFSGDPAAAQTIPGGGNAWSTANAAVRFLFKEFFILTVDWEHAAAPQEKRGASPADFAPASIINSASFRKERRLLPAARTGVPGLVFRRGAVYTAAMNATTSRLASLDALRGLDMLCIAGLDALAFALAEANPGSGWAHALAEQFSHSPWEGLRLYDLIFPLFTFLAGVSMSFSLARRKTRREAAWRLARRAAALIALGWAVNGAVTLDADMRCASVLGLIGLSCFGGGLAYLLAGWRGALAGAALALAFVGIGQCLYGDFTPEGCLNARIDQALLPGRLHSGSYDPEGVLCVVSSIALNLLGLLSGCWLRHAAGPTQRALALPLAGGALFCLGYLVLPQLGYPCVKNIWTVSFVLASAGISIALLALFRLLADAAPLGAKATFPLRVIGMNALACYLVTHLIDFGALTRRLFAGVCRLLAPAEWQGAALAAASILLVWALMASLHRHGVFFRA